MQTHPFDTLTLENGAQLIFTPCPGTKDTSIEQAISTLKQAGTNMLVTLMFDEEMEKNNALSLAYECEQQEVKWVQLPISDEAGPEQTFEQQWQLHKEHILAVIQNKGRVAVHCKGGSGRTGLVIGLILLAYGWSGDKVIEAVQQIRPKALKHPVQLEYFNSHVS